MKLNTTLFILLIVFTVNLYGHDYIFKEGRYYVTNGFLQNDKADKLQEETTIKATDFGFRKPGESYFIFDSVYFGSKQDPVIILDARVMGLMDTVFQLEILDDIPALDGGMDFNVWFEPTEVQDYYDYIVFKLLHAGDTLDVLMPVKGTSRVDLLIWADNGHEFEIGTEVSIPLWIKIDEEGYHQDLIDLDYTLTISMDAAIMIPNDAVKAEITNEYIQGDKRFITIKGFIPFVKKEKHIMAVLKGVSLLSLDKFTEVAIDPEQVNWGKEWIVTSTQPGSFKTSTICLGDKNIISFLMPEPVWVISPNPAGDFINLSVESEEEGLFNLKIYSLEGVLFKDVYWEHNSLEKETSTIDVSDLTSGYYYTILKTPFYLSEKPVILNK